MSPLQWPTPTFASLAFLLLSLGSFSDSTSSRGHTASLLPRENVRGIHGEDDISFAGRNIQNEDEGSVESETETKVLDSREERKRPYIPLNSLTFMTANSHVSTIDWSSTDPSQIRQYIAGSKLAGIPQTSTIRPASQKLTTSTLPPFPLIHKTTTKRSTPLTKNPFLLTTRRPALPTVVRNVSTTSSVLLNSRPITTFRTPTTPTTIRPTASAIVSSTASGMHTSSTTRRLTAITGRPVELTTGSIKSTTSPLITWKPSSLAIRNTSAVTSTSSIITWRPSSLANSNTYAITAEGTSDKPMTSATELTTIGSTFFTQWFTNNGNSLTTGFSPTTEKIPPPPTELPPPLDSIKPPLLSTWRPTLRPIPNYVKVTTQPPTTQSMSSSTTTDLPVNKLNPNASTEHSPVLSLDNNYTTSSPAVQESHSPISGMSTALPIRNTPTPNCVNVTTEALTTQSTSTTTQVPVNQVNPSAATENSPFLSWNNNFYSTSSPVVQESYSPTVRTTTSSAPLLRITRWTSTISPQVVTSQPVQRPGNTGHMPAHQNKFNSDSMEGQGIKPIKHATPPSEQQNYETEHEPLSHWQYLDSSPQPVDSYTTRPQLVVTNNFISDDDQKLIHEAFNRFQTHFSSATDSSTTWQEDIQDTDVPQIPTIEEPGAIGLAPQQPLWTTTQLLDDNKTSSVFHDDMVWYLDSSNEYNPNVSWITNPRPQVSHNFPFTSEVTRDPITTPDPALFEIISGSSNESPEKFPSNTDQSQFMTSKPTQIPTHTTSKQELFTISENGSHPTRASILRPLISPEVQVDTHAELFKVSQPDEVPGSSLAASLPTVDSNDDYDFDYAVYEDDLSEYYAVYGYLQGVEHEEDRQSKPDKLLTFDLDKNSPSILETLTWPYTTIPTKRPLDSDSAYSRFPAVEIKNPINSHDTSETKYTSHLISSSNKENMSSVLPLEISTKESNFTTVSSSIYTYSSLIPAYPQSQSLAASIPLSLSENEYANFLTENGSTYPDYNDAYYYSYEDTPVVNDFQSSLQVDYSLQVGDSSVSRPLGSEQDNLNVNPLPHSDLPASQVDTSKLQDFHLQANNNPHNLNVYNVGFLDTSYIPKIIKTTTTTRQPPVLYAPADRESQQSHNGSPTQDLETFVALNPLKPTVADVELESVQ